MRVCCAFVVIVSVFVLVQFAQFLLAWSHAICTSLKPTAHQSLPFLHASFALSDYLLSHFMSALYKVKLAPIIRNHCRRVLFILVQFVQASKRHNVIFLKYNSTYVIPTHVVVMQLAQALNPRHIDPCPPSCLGFHTLQLPPRPIPNCTLTRSIFRPHTIRRCCQCSSY